MIPGQPAQLSYSHNALALMRRRLGNRSRGKGQRRAKDGTVSVTETSDGVTNRHTGQSTKPTVRIALAAAENLKKQYLNYA